MTAEPTMGLEARLDGILARHAELGQLMASASGEAYVALAREFAAFAGGLLLKPRYNIAPMQDVVVVRETGGRRTLSTVRWGLIPFWAKDPAIASKLINARAESAAGKPSFREAMQRRRCIVPASGFYEWRPVAGGKQPYFIRPVGGEALFGFAGLLERWTDPTGPC